MATPGPKDNQILTVFAVAGEGGGYRIEAHVADKTWRFRAVRNDRIVEGDEINRADPWKASFEEALEEINSGWPRLYPVRVHDVVAQKVRSLVRAYSARLDNEQLERWRRVCDGEDAED